MRIRLATPADADELVRLRGVMFDAEGAASPPGATWRAACRAVFAERLGGPDLFAGVAEVPSEPGRLVASAVGLVHLVLPRPRAVETLQGCVVSVATEEAHRRQGLARAVMARLLEEFDRRGVPTVDLLSSAMGAGVYRSLGFDPHPYPYLRRRAGG